MPGHAPPSFNLTQFWRNDMANGASVYSGNEVAKSAINTLRTLGIRHDGSTFVVIPKSGKNKGKEIERRIGGLMVLRALCGWSLKLGTATKKELVAILQVEDETKVEQAIKSSVRDLRLSGKFPATCLPSFGSGKRGRQSVPVADVVNDNLFKSLGLV